MPPLRLSTVPDIFAALADGAVPRIIIAPGTYTFTADDCRDHLSVGAALCIDRDVIIEAAVPGSVVLDAGGSSSNTERRMLFIKGGATVELIGLMITGGFLIDPLNAMWGTNRYVSAHTNTRPTAR